MFGKQPDYLPLQDVRTYRIFCLLLYMLFVVGLIYGAMSFLFPYNLYQVDFNNPDATKNTLFAPHSQDFSPIEEGKIPSGDSLFLYANNWHILESGTIEITPSENSKRAPGLEGGRITLRHGWAAAFAPQSETALDIPNIAVVEYANNYYELRDSALLAFVSKGAALSHVPESSIRKLSPDEFTRLPKSEELLGFRIGTLISYADGVFVVSEDNIIRPFGSAKILLRMGYTFNHVIPANAEEAGIYKRGKVILPGQLHPIGTLFQEVASGKIFVYEKNQLSSLSNAYSDFLTRANDVVLFSEKDSAKEISCSLQRKFLQESYACKVAIDFSHGMGDDYQIAFANTGQTLDIAGVSAGFQASGKTENAKFVTILLINRVLERFGMSRE